ncbi:MAG TPA: 4Fe-4S dicluster domain-containing protein, partial [Salinivirga sp.]|uniref:SLBB domain-containing protein n=1 Tax=Salinivirga sp. TaxID=1970192 RepID=UPI002B46CFFF
SVKKPSNLMVRIGTPVENLIEAAGGFPEDTGKVVSGGPMMGKALNDLAAPVTKGTSGVLLFKDSEAHRIDYEACIRCGKCVTACPMGLEPYQLMNYATHEMWKESEADRIMDCIECGSCSFTCPSYRPLLDYIRLGKSNVSQIIRSRKQ